MRVGGAPKGHPFSPLMRTLGSAFSSVVCDSESFQALTEKLDRLELVLESKDKVHL